MSNKIYFENLNGLRFLCFLSVFFYHSFHTDFLIIKETSIYHFVKFGLFGNGNLGVNFFFVLSGFLITYLIIQEIQKTGRLQIRKFWLRRVLRIWPLYIFCVVFGFFIFPLIKQLFGQTPVESANIYSYLLFISNFEIIKKGLPDASVLGVLWSIAIEEQFYLVWPVLMSLFSIKNYWIPFTFVIGLSLLFRTYYTGQSYYEFHTMSCMGDLAVGSFGAWLIALYPNFKTSIENMKRRYIILMYIFLVLVYLLRKEVFYSLDVLMVFERVIIAVLFLMVVLEQSYAKKSLFKMKNLKLMSKWGEITYGLYCLHFIGILIATNFTKLMSWNSNLWQTLFLDTFLALSISMVIAKLSYSYFETPFLNFKKRFRNI